MTKLSIIIPIYNVEKYILQCLESVFCQRLDEERFEVILVNDGTEDNSFGVIGNLVSSHNNIIVLEQENQGLSAARNTGLAKAKGEYVLFLDSDDLLIKDTLSLLLEKALESEADMVVADFVKMDNKEIENISSQTFPPTASLTPLAVSGKVFFLGEFNPQQCYVWRTLYKLPFLQRNGLRFIPGIYFEDVPFTTECYLRADRCLRVNQTFYVYRQRSNSIVSSISMKKLTDFNTVLARLSQMKGDLCPTEELRHRMDDTIFTTFSIAVWYLTHDKALLADRHTFVSDLRQKIGNLNCNNGLKQRLVSFLFRHIPETYIWLRSV